MAWSAQSASTAWKTTAATTCAASCRGIRTSFSCRTSRLRPDRARCRTGHAGSSQPHRPWHHRDRTDDRIATRASATRRYPALEPAGRGLLAVGRGLRRQPRRRARAGCDRAAACPRTVPAGMRGRRLLVIDCPCTFRAIAALQQDLALARRLGFQSKCVVFPEHVVLVHGAFAPTAEAVQEALALCEAWERQRRRPRKSSRCGSTRPGAGNARRLLARHRALAAHAGDGV